MVSSDLICWLVSEFNMISYGFGMRMCPRGGCRCASKCLIYIPKKGGGDSFHLIS
ncbi:hypothetical protein HanIR_Chr06g0266141 [Helianthus annuus]|nr:hypothetical protein HanIR_Chr06g0266141 [Helianthus annuus]